MSGLSRVFSGPIRELSTIPAQYSFTPNFKTIAKFCPTASEKDFFTEPSMYSATTDFVKKHGGPLANLILKKIPKSYYNAAQSLGLFPNIDIRVHQFDPSFFNTPGLELFPAIPGLHCDGEWRETYFSQPDLSKIPVSHHLIATIATRPGISSTQFFLNKINFSMTTPSAEYTVWEEVDKLARTHPHPKWHPMKDGHLTLFDARSLHEATPIKFPGCRLFFRCSMWHRPNLGEGQLSSNEQLYTVFTPLLSSPLTSPVIHGSSDSLIEINTSPQYQVIDQVQSTYPIEDLAKEPGLVNADPAFIQKHGGPIAKFLLRKIPESFFQEAIKQSLRPKIDFLVYRLYPSYQANFPGYDHEIRLSGWHLPMAQNQIFKKHTPEIHVSLSSHAEGVNHTELSLLKQTLSLQPNRNSYYFWNSFNQKITGLPVPDQENLKNTVLVKDGSIVLTNSHTARRETSTINRGWRAIFRASMREAQEKDSVGTIVKQQYVQVPYVSKGW